MLGVHDTLLTYVVHDSLLNWLHTPTPKPLAQLLGDAYVYKVPLHAVMVNVSCVSSDVLLHAGLAAVLCIRSVPAVPIRVHDSPVPALLSHYKASFIIALNRYSRNLRSLRKSPTPVDHT